MTFHEQATSYDIEQEYIYAAFYYELAIAEERTADAFIDLAVFYFQFTDFGINSASRLPLDFIHTAFARYHVVIDRGIATFPLNNEMRFWKAYFHHRTVYDDWSEADVLKFLNDDNSNLVPFFHLYLFDPEKYSEQRDALLKDCGSRLTSKNRWILSLIDTAPL
jgi:hypothetical protein